VSGPAAGPGGPAPLAGIYAGTLDCVHCGLCLTSCPTYLATGRETSSPRGRVYLMRAVAEARIPLEAVREEAQLCLGCRACETACPSGVRYGALLEETRGELQAAGHQSDLPGRLERLLLRGLIPRRRRLALVVELLVALQRTRLDRLGVRLLPARLRAAHALLPELPARRERARLPERTPAEGRRRGRVAIFEGCIMPELFGGVNRAAVRVLAREGFEVLVPSGQGCCGALQAHAGDAAFARTLAARNASTFDLREVDAVISTSAGCGATLGEYHRWCPGSGDALAKAHRDVCEFLDEVGLKASLAPVPLRVCYDDPCHLLHGQGVGGAPRRLLDAIPLLELVPHDDPGSCCGAAGTYNLTQPEMSRVVLARKLDALAAAAPDVIATGNPGCLMQLRAGARERGLGARVLHPVELLDLSMQESVGS
jgi:glycolate oxidase iron-sulfur subunit